MSQSKQYVGLDVSLKETSICVIDNVGKIVWRGRTESTPEAIASAVEAMRAQLLVYNKAVIQRARGDDTARRRATLISSGTFCAEGMCKMERKWRGVHKQFPLGNFQQG
jgi:hypothetical protein